MNSRMFLRINTVARLLGLASALATASAVAASGSGWAEDPWSSEARAGPSWSVHGFAEGAGGVRTRDNPVIDDDVVLGELRSQLEVDVRWRDLTMEFKGDALADRVEDGVTGDLRELNVAFEPSANTAVRAGRQILTWGTGDLLFLNDLFPKDFVSFFIGRDTEYLKAPSDAVKLSVFRTQASLNVVWSPVFDPDRFITGERLSYFSPQEGTQVAAPPKLSPRQPDDFPDDGELAVRLYNTVEGLEWALYGYRGFFKQPTALDPVSGRPTFSRLNVLGGSLRDALFGGIGNVEVAWYDSVEDRDGTDPFTPNSQLRFLTGHERELVSNLELGLQYYLEWTRQHQRLIDNAPNPAYVPEEFRHVLTARLTYAMSRDNLRWSLFTFYSPSDRDYYFRPAMHYRWSDAVSTTLGGNLFGGEQRHTLFAQMTENSNVYARIRYSY